jgi:hypothetical protein
MEAFILLGLNSVEFENLWYYGRIDSVQLAWLKKDVGSGFSIYAYHNIPAYPFF